MIGGYQVQFPPREYDTAQICLNGHLINEFAATKPNRNKKYCDRCGEATFTHCPSCNAPIQGYHLGLRGPSKYTIPKYCYECSKMYPWTKERFEAARALVDELKLSDAEKEDVKQSIKDLVQDGPRAEGAAVKFKRLVNKGGEWALDTFRELLVDVLSETAKKIIFPN